MSKLYKQTNRAAQNAVAEDGRWLMGVPAIVADNRDSERQHRVRVIIPSIDEDAVYDEWARMLVFCLGSGFGSAFIPPVNSEVVLFGQLGQKFNLYYASLYNEEMLMPENFDDEMTVGIHAPGELRVIAEQVAKILAQNIEVTAEQKISLNGQNIEAVAEQFAKLKGNDATVEATATALLKGNQINVNGSTITIQSDGSLSISGGSVSINGSNVTIRGRQVLPSGPPI